MAHEHSIEIHLLHELAAVLDLQSRDDFEGPDRLFGQLAAVGLDEADDDVLPLGAAVVGLAKHREGLAASRRGAQKHSQVAASDSRRRDRRRSGRDCVGHRCNDARESPPVNASAGEAGLLCVECQIELENVDHRLPEDPQDASL